ncbi:DNA-binding protein [Sulfurimonas paralvinellae]|uniref:DNA-binding protein n=1 Tax=Sulfurimonas paralvinellae TaxID=317658 RepID=A0A7M1B517_9BACT|nr:DNA-binding protein [Sulfurimonas paralvinellae]QOP44819.1 DNA-binding protein [Sulfurimonas paralvinellae]
MKKMSVAEAAEFFGVSKEAIHNRIRRGSLKSSLGSDGVKMVMVDETRSVKKAVSKRAVKNSANDDRYYKLLEAQNAKLQERVEVLENETRSLRDQKEQMLIEERQKIEAIYKEKDEQLKNILQTLSSKFMLGAPLETEETLEAEMVELEEEELKSNVISLKKYLKSSGFSEKKMKKIKKRFKEKAKNDERIVIIGTKYYLDTGKYDYSDLIK